MGSVEMKLKHDMMKKSILETLEKFSIVSELTLPQNVLRLLRGYGIKKTYNNKFRYSFFKSQKLLIEKGFIIQTKNKKFTLTLKGRLLLHKLQGSPRKPKWDKKWRVVIFDIFENRRKTRNHIRNGLRSIGFRKLQNSVWIYPYNCEEYITLIKSENNVGFGFLYMIVDHIEGEEKIKKLFSLT